MKFVLLNRDTGTGGLQTAVLRVAKWLHSRGHDVVVLSQVRGNLASEIEKYSRIIGLSYFEYFGLRSSPAIDEALRGANVVHTFSWDSLILALLIADRYNAALVVGVYHPRAYNFFPARPRPFYAEYYRKLFNQLPDQNIMFMNESTRETARVDFGRPFARSELLPVPMSLPAVARREWKHEGRPVRLLSVGRLVNFKRYPFGILQTMAREGWNEKALVFTVCGAGPYRQQLEDEVRRLGLSSVVKLCGEISYSRYLEVLNEHDIFVGMGTAALEAAATGMPTLVAPAYGNGLMLGGFFHEQSGFDFGERVGTVPTTDLLRKIIELSPDGYARLAALDRKAAEQFDVDVVMNRYCAWSAGLASQGLALPKLSKADLLRVILSGAISTRVPIVTTYWRRRNWHHPAQDL